MSKGKPQGIVDRRWRWVRHLYNVVLIGSIPALILYLFYRWMRGKSREGWGDRLGVLPSPGEQPVVWIHAVSAGEAVAAEALVRAIRRCLPEVHLVYTAGTPEGRATAIQRMGNLLDHVAYVPYDFPWMVRRAMNRVQPQLFVLVESELWPNLLQAAKERGVPVLLANGYISEKTLRKGRWVPFLYRWIFSNINTLCVQSEEVRQRALALGADPARIRVTGSVKYDQATEPLPPERAAAWQALFQIQPEEPVLVAGSTHPGEETAVLEAYRQLWQSGVPLRLILAPRHPRRADEVEALIREAGHPVVRRTQIQPDANRSIPRDAVLLLDTMGELAGVFSVATVVFLGGSLVPVGGHDILQPLIAGKPVLVGPYTHRQRETVDDALKEGVVWRVKNAQELAQRAAELIADCRRDNGYAERAVHFVFSHQGASERCAEEAVRLLCEANPRWKRRNQSGSGP